MDSEFDNDMCLQEETMIFSSWIYTLFGEETWPCKDVQPL